jgi:hypothetical protein
MASIGDAERAGERFRMKFGRLQGVRGVGVTWNDRGDAHIRVNVDANARDSVSRLIPEEFDGIEIELRSVQNMRGFAG